MAATVSLCGRVEALFEEMAAGISLAVAHATEMRMT